MSVLNDKFALVVIALVTLAGCRQPSSDELSAIGDRVEQALPAVVVSSDAVVSGNRGTLTVRIAYDWSEPQWTDLQSDREIDVHRIDDVVATYERAGGRWQLVECQQVRVESIALNEGETSRSKPGDTNTISAEEIRTLVGNVDQSQNEETWPSQLLQLLLNET